MQYEFHFCDIHKISSTCKTYFWLKVVLFASKLFVTVFLVLQAKFPRKSKQVK